MSSRAEGGGAAHLHRQLQGQLLDYPPLHRLLLFLHQFLLGQSPREKLLSTNQCMPSQSDLLLRFTHA
jgi:hypothetical protein